MKNAAAADAADAAGPLCYADTSAKATLPMHMQEINLFSSLTGHRGPAASAASAAAAFINL